MQKKLIALAVAGLASGAAFAQSNVTIYGVMDATLENVSAKSATFAGEDLGGRARINSNSSYIGFKGTESLGNGLAAAWQIESGIQSENGASSGFNTRDTYVGLAGGFGTVVFGNVTGPTRALGAKVDVNSGATGIGDNNALLGKGVLAAAGFGSGASPFDQRISNAIAYISPNFSGFSGVLGYSTGFTGVNGFGNFAGKQNDNLLLNTTGSAKGNTAWTLGLNYENGPIYVGYAYTVVNTTNDGVALADGLGVPGLGGVFEKAQDNRLGVKYDFGMGTVGLLWDQPKYRAAGTGSAGAALFGAGSDMKQTVYYIPVTFNVGGQGKVLFQYGHANNVTGMGGLFSSVGDTGANHYEIGYEHSLSKRTIVKAYYSRISNKDNAGFDFLYGVSAPNTTAPGAGAVGAGSKPEGIGFGIRHSF